MYFKFILRNKRPSSFFPILFRLPAVRSPHTLNRRSAYACDAGAEIRSMAILDRSGYSALRACQNSIALQFRTVPEHISAAYLESLVSWTNTSRCWLGTRTGQLLLQELEPRVSGAQSANCRSAAFRELLSALLSFSFWIFFVFVLVFVTVFSLNQYNFTYAFVTEYVTVGHHCY